MRKHGAGQFAIGLFLIVLSVIIGYLYVSNPAFLSSLFNNPDGNPTGSLLIALVPLIFFVVGIIAIYSSLNPNFGERPRWM